jgi:hypothetical protein
MTDPSRAVPGLLGIHKRYTNPTNSVIIVFETDREKYLFDSVSLLTQRVPITPNVNHNPLTDSNQFQNEKKQIIDFINSVRKGEKNSDEHVNNPPSQTTPTQLDQSDQPTSSLIPPVSTTSSPHLVNNFNNFDFTHYATMCTNQLALIDSFSPALVTSPLYKAIQTGQYTILSEIGVDITFDNDVLFDITLPMIPISGSSRIHRHSVLYNDVGGAGDNGDGGFEDKSMGGTGSVGTNKHSLKSAPIVTTTSDIGSDFDDDDRSVTGSGNDHNVEEKSKVLFNVSKHKSNNHHHSYDQNIVYKTVLSKSLISQLLGSYPLTYLQSKVNSLDVDFYDLNFNTNNYISIHPNKLALRDAGHIDHNDDDEEDADGLDGEEEFNSNGVGTVIAGIFDDDNGIVVEKKCEIHPENNFNDNYNNPKQIPEISQLSQFLTLNFDTINYITDSTSQPNIPPNTTLSPHLSTNDDNEESDKPHHHHHHHHSHSNKHSCLQDEESIEDTDDDDEDAENGSQDQDDEIDHTGMSASEILNQRGRISVANPFNLLVKSKLEVLEKQHLHQLRQQQEQVIQQQRDFEANGIGIGSDECNCGELRKNPPLLAVVIPQDEGHSTSQLSQSSRTQLNSSGNIIPMPPIPKQNSLPQFTHPSSTKQLSKSPQQTQMETKLLEEYQSLNMPSSRSFGGSGEFIGIKNSSRSGQFSPIVKPSLPNKPPTHQSPSMSLLQPFTRPSSRTKDDSYNFVNVIGGENFKGDEFVDEYDDDDRPTRQSLTLELSRKPLVVNASAQSNGVVDGALGNNDENNKDGEKNKNKKTKPPKHPKSFFPDPYKNLRHLVWTNMPEIVDHINLTQSHLSLRLYGDDLTGGGSPDVVEKTATTSLSISETNSLTHGNLFPFEIIHVLSELLHLQQSGADGDDGDDKFDIFNKSSNEVGKNNPKSEQIELLYKLFQLQLLSLVYQGFQYDMTKGNSGLLDDDIEHYLQAQAIGSRNRGGNQQRCVIAGAPSNTAEIKHGKKFEFSKYVEVPKTNWLPMNNKAADDDGAGAFPNLIVLHFNLQSHIVSRHLTHFRHENSNVNIDNIDQTNSHDDNIPDKVLDDVLNNIITICRNFFSEQALRDSIQGVEYELMLDKYRKLAQHIDECTDKNTQELLYRKINTKVFDEMVGKNDGKNDGNNNNNPNQLCDYYIDPSQEANQIVDDIGDGYWDYDEFDPDSDDSDDDDDDDDDDRNNNSNTQTNKKFKLLKHLNHNKPIEMTNSSKLTPKPLLIPQYNPILQFRIAKYVSKHGILPPLTFHHFFHSLLPSFSPSELLLLKSTLTESIANIPILTTATCTPYTAQSHDQIITSIPCYSQSARYSRFFHNNTILPRFASLRSFLLPNGGLGNGDSGVKVNFDDYLSRLYSIIKSSPHHRNDLIYLSVINPIMIPQYLHVEQVEGDNNVKKDNNLTIAPPSPNSLALTPFNPPPTPEQTPDDTLKLLSSPEPAGIPVPKLIDSKSLFSSLNNKLQKRRCDITLPDLQFAQDMIQDGQLLDSKLEQIDLHQFVELYTQTTHSAIQLLHSEQQLLPNKLTHYQNVLTNGNKTRRRGNSSASLVSPTMTPQASTPSETLESSSCSSLSSTKPTMRSLLPPSIYDPSKQSDRPLLFPPPHGDSDKIVYVNLPSQSCDFLQGTRIIQRNSIIHSAMVNLDLYTPDGVVTSFGSSHYSDNMSNCNKSHHRRNHSSASATTSMYDVVTTGIGPGNTLLRINSVNPHTIISSSKMYTAILNQQAQFKAIYFNDKLTKYRNATPTVDTPSNTLYNRQYYQNLIRGVRDGGDQIVQFSSLSDAPSSVKLQPQQVLPYIQPFQHISIALISSFHPNSVRPGLQYTEIHRLREEKMYNLMMEHKRRVQQRRDKFEGEKSLKKGPKTETKTVIYTSDGHTRVVFTTDADMTTEVPVLVETYHDEEDQGRLLGEKVKSLDYSDSVKKKVTQAVKKNEFEQSVLFEENREYERIKDTLGDEFDFEDVVRKVVVKDVMKIDKERTNNENQNDKDGEQEDGNLLSLQQHIVYDNGIVLLSDGPVHIHQLLPHISYKIGQASKYGA